MSNFDENGANLELEEMLSAEPHAVKQLYESSEIRKELGDEDYREKNPKQDFATLKQLEESYKELEEADRARIASKVGEYIVAWAGEYNPDINIKTSQLPLEQRYFPDMFEAATTTYDELEERSKLAALELARKTLEVDQNWWQNHPKSSHNNRFCYSLELRASAAALIAKNDSEEGLTLAVKTKADFGKHLETFVDESGATVDFNERDSLHYQIFGLQPLLETAILFTNEGLALTAEENDALTRAVDFLKPYASGEKTHLEFVHTTNQRDPIRYQERLGQPYLVEDNQELSDIFSVYNAISHA